MCKRAKKIFFLAAMVFIVSHLHAQVGVSSLLLTGGPSALKVSDNSALDIQSNMTVEAWINPCSLDTHNIIASKQLCSGPYYSWNFSIRQNLLQFTWDDVGDCASTNIYRANGNPIQIDEWTHVAVVHKNSGITLYINGNQVAGTLIQGSYTSIRSGIADMYIGAYLNQSANTPQAFLQGRIDDFRVWAKAKTAVEINSEMNTPLVGNETGLRAYYNMEPANVLPVIKNNCTTTGSVLDGRTTASTSNTTSITPNSKDLNNLDLGNDTTLCFGDTILLSAKDAGLNYTWFPNASNSTDSLSVYLSNTYFVTASLTSGAICSRTDSITVTFNRPRPNLGPDTSLCADFYILDAGPFDAFEWSTGENSQQISPTTSGNYAVTVSDSIGCKGMDEIVLNISPPLVFDLGPDRNICRGDQITLSGPLGMASYLWNTGSTASTLSTTSGGVFWLRAFDPNGCDNADTIVITELDVEYVDFSLDSAWCPDDIIQFSLPQESQYWLDGHRVSGMVSIYDTGNYSLRVLNTCADDTFDLQIYEADKCPCYYYSPSAFSPNGDNTNDLYKHYSDCDFIQFQLHIVDRWGQVVFETYDFNEQWNGRYMNSEELVKEGFYTYQATYSTRQGHRHATKSGRVYVIR